MRPVCCWSQSPSPAPSKRRRPPTTAAAVAASRRFDWPTARPSCWTAGSTSRSGRRSVPADNFIQQDPQNGGPATEPTEVRIAFDDESLYLGVTCFDSEPDKWLGYQRRRDEGLNSDDRFMWTIDTFLDGRTGYFFEMNPSGLMADSLLGINGENREWDGIWNARALRSEIGWTLEIVIPSARSTSIRTATPGASTFSAPCGARTKKASGWAGCRNQGLRRMSNAGVVTGIRDVTQGHGLDSSRTASSRRRPRRGAAAPRSQAMRARGSISSTVRRRCCARSSPSTPISPRPRSISARST